jgi:hypothetical protein
MGVPAPSEMALVKDAAPEAPVPRWIDPGRIRASTARDVLERVDDDRSRAERREQASQAFAAARLSRGPRLKFTFGAKAKTKAKRKVERTPEVREYFRQYMQRRRARDRDKQGDGREVRHAD